MNRPTPSFVMRRAVIDDAGVLASLVGLRYAIVRPSGALDDAFERTQAQLRESLSDVDAMYPGPHLTLAAFARASELREIQATVRRWATRTAPFRLVAEAVDVFEPPHAVVFLALRKTASLARAYGALATEARARRLALVDARPVGEWRPHLSLAYLEAPARGWEEIAARARGTAGAWRKASSVGASPERASCLARMVELLAYDDRGEQVIATYALAESGPRG
jgi:hypothetical protein